MIKAMLEKLSMTISDFLWRTITPDTLNFCVYTGGQSRHIILRGARIWLCNPENKSVVSALYTPGAYKSIRELKRRNERFVATLQGKFAFIKTQKDVMSGSGKFYVSLLDSNPGECKMMKVEIDGRLDHADIKELERIR